MARNKTNSGVGFYDDFSENNEQVKQGMKAKEEIKTAETAPTEEVKVTKEEGSTVPSSEPIKEKKEETPTSELTQNINKDSLYKLFPCNIKLPGYMNIPLERYIAEEKEKDVKMYDFILIKERKINKSAIFAEAMKDWMIKKGILTEEELDEFVKVIPFTRKV